MSGLPKRPVDVLAVMARMANCQYDGTMAGRYLEEEARAARAAVAELRDAARPFAHLLAGKTINDPVTLHTVEVSAADIHRMAQAIARLGGDA